MTNPLPGDMITGTLGEIFVELRLLEHNIQSVAPRKDTGNDLLAIYETVFRTIQVKTTTGDIFEFDYRKLKERQYDILALVQIVSREDQISWDQSKIYMLRPEDVTKGTYRPEEIEEHLISRELIERLFSK